MERKRIFHILGKLRGADTHITRRPGWDPKTSAQLRFAQGSESVLRIPESDLVYAHEII